MEITKETIIGNLVAHDYRTATVFKQYQVDFCCNGNRTIQDACAGKGKDITGLIDALQREITGNAQPLTDYQSWPIDLLADYIEKKHHRYVTQRIREITPFLQKLVKVHGDHHPELEQIAELFKGSAAALTEHMKDEEQVLFPYVREVVTGTAKPSISNIEQPVEIMMKEHDHEGERFRDIERLTDHYTPPPDACNTYKVTFALLKEFQEDLHLHIHLENNILFPKVLALRANPGN